MVAAAAVVFVAVVATVGALAAVVVAIVAADPGTASLLAAVSAGKEGSQFLSLPCNLLPFTEVIGGLV